MKKYLRLFLFNTVALWLAIKVLPGVTISDGYKTIALTSLALTLINLLVKPLINLLILPINLLTLGTLRWLVNIITLYLVTIIISQFKIAGFFFAGWNYQGFIIPAIYLSGFWVYLLTSLLISLTVTFLLWLVK